jgi:probable rRNA maturation factor
LKIQIFYDEVDFRIKNWRKIKKLVEKVISDEERIPGDLNFIVTDDESLKSINIQFLKHNYFTDVICFSDSIEGVISGEIYISIDMVRKNSVNYKVSLNDEVIRVFVHGVLHLIGFDDKTEREKSRMRKKEDYWLNVYNSY